MQVIGQPTPFAPAVVGAIAVGGAIGAIARWGVDEIVGTIGSTPSPASWPWATLIVNIVGCALIGLAARLLRRDSIAWDFAVTGVLGGFTTFSALRSTQVMPQGGSWLSGEALRRDSPEGPYCRILRTQLCEE